MKKLAIPTLAAAFAGTLLTASIAEARPGYRGGYAYRGYGGYRSGYRRGSGIGGALAAGAALGLIGGAIAASQAQRYSYPAYGYEYAPAYGYAPAPTYGYPAYGY